MKQKRRTFDVSFKRQVVQMIRDQGLTVGQKDYANHAEASRDVTDYIVGFYNNVRLHSTPGYLPPTIYQRQAAVQHPIDVSEIT